MTIILRRGLALVLRIIKHFDLHSLQNDELGFIPHDIIAPPSHELGDTVDAPNGDTQEGNNKASQKKQEFGASTNLHRESSLVRTISVGAQEEIGGESGKDQ